MVGGLEGDLGIFDRKKERRREGVRSEKWERKVKFEEV